MRFASQRLRYSLPQPLERGTPTAHRPTQRGHPSALSEENGRLDFGVSGVVLTRRTKTVIHHAPFHDLSEQTGKGKQKTARVARIRALACALNEQNDPNLKVLRARVPCEFGT